MGSDSNKTENKHWQSINEFFWMWLASISPIIFGSFFVKLKFSDTSYLNILFNSIEVDTVFAYVATMIAPFLFILGRFITAADDAKRKIKNIKYGGLLVVISIVITVVISGLFYEYKIETKKFIGDSKSASISQFSNAKKSSAETSSPKEVSTETSFAQNSTTGNSLTNIWNHLGLKGKVLLVCYLVSLLIWYYTIYLRHLEAPDIQEGENVRVQDLLAVITQQTKGK